MISDQTRRQKSREVSSRYLSTTVAPPSPPLGYSNHNPKPKPKHKHTAFIRNLWSSSISKNEAKNNVKTSENSPVLTKQKSCTEFRHSEKIRDTKNNSKERYTPVFGGRSMRFTGKVLFDANHDILPGRLSVDENTLRRRSSYDRMRMDSFSDSSETSDVSSTFRSSPVSYMAPTLSSKRFGSDVHAKCNSPLISMHSSPKNCVHTRRASSLSSSEWESSPSRLGMGLGSPSFSSSKPPASSARGKKNILHIGLDLIKGKKGGGAKLQCRLGSDMGVDTESVHRLRLLQNGLMQWRYVNAKAQHVQENLAAQSEYNLLCGYESVAKLRQSVVQKRLQLQKEKQAVKLNLIIHSQTKMLEAWGDIERRHMLDVSVMKDYLHAVVCMIPLIEGAKVDINATTMAFQDTSHMVATIKSTLSSVFPTADETMGTLSELAEVVIQEKLLLEECLEHLGLFSTLEIQERNLRCSIIAMNSSKEQRRQKQQMFM